MRNDNQEGGSFRRLASAEFARSEVLTLRSKGRCAIKLRSAPELGRYAASSR
jgi:hypothetical protein